MFDVRHSQLGQRWAQALLRDFRVLWRARRAMIQPLGRALSAFLGWGSFTGLFGGISEPHPKPHCKLQGKLQRPKNMVQVLLPWRPQAAEAREGLCMGIKGLQGLPLVAAWGQ